eukprot:CAMPEP_0115121766 /NCGR_PEP_ID=MMETSP0227-20121206/46433_1 /TAXON_ID=89957 /ORGANISM="Polarella glacialis, Strain CCMP 1383" /LENGTH=521 /DNA_ID=CAMNT_0002523591 /DNA_START=58 /DNA_END=1623 /DNA_ORIENTATION=+
MELADEATGAAVVQGPDSLSSDVPDLEALQGRIMAEIEAKLSQKEDSLWRRGQVEIKRLQLEQKEVNSAVTSLQERQEALLKENQKIRGALVEVTSKFEQVVKQMREVLRALPQPQVQQTGADVRSSPSPSEASTTASGEAAREHRENEPPASASLGAAQLQTPMKMWHGSRGVSSSSGSGAPDTFGEAHRLPKTPTAPSARPRGVSEAADAQNSTFKTPPRGNVCSPGEDAFFSAALSNGMPPPASWGSATTATGASPAVLSLASALPSSTATLTPSPSPGPLKRLQLAECLGDQVSSNIAVVVDREMMKTPPLPGLPEANYNLVTVELVKEPGFVTLGIEVDQVDGGLRVDWIDEHGLVGRFNATQAAKQKGEKVHIGDQIIEVNGFRRDPNRMLHECKVGQRLALTLSRRAQASSGKDGVAADEHQDAVSSSGKTGSPVARKLRPEAQVFVPSAQKEGPPSSFEAPAPSALPPPGLEHSVGAVSALLATSPTLLTEDATESANLSAVEGPEVKRALFH